MVHKNSSKDIHKYNFPTNILKPAFHEQRIVVSPTQSTLAKSSLKGLLYRAYKNELHFTADLGGDIMLDVLPICPGQDDLLDLRAVGSQDLSTGKQRIVIDSMLKYLLLDSTNGRDTSTEGDFTGHGNVFGYACARQ